MSHRPALRVLLRCVSILKASGEDDDDAAVLDELHGYMCGVVDAEEQGGTTMPDEPRIKITKSKGGTRWAAIATNGDNTANGGQAYSRAIDREAGMRITLHALLIHFKLRLAPESLPVKK